MVACSGRDSATDKPEEKEPLHIATAANMQFAMDSVAKVFEAEYGYPCQVTANSSGMLTAQIENGAPFDVFVSANMKYPNELKKKGLGEKPEIYAFGKLVLVYPKNKPFSGVEEVLSDPGIRRIAIANKETAPYGMAATEFLQVTGLYTKYEKKLVTGESIGQVNQYLVSGSVEAAFTSSSFLTEYGNQFRFLEIDQKYFKEISQGMQILKYGRKNNPQGAEQLLEFLTSEKGKAILTHFGYRVN